MALNAVLCMIVEDFYFYFVHRLLHHRLLYKYIHKRHHDHTAPFGMAGEYAHPLETILLGVGTTAGPLLFTRHLATLWVWLLVRVVQVVECHSGYDFPWSPNRWLPFWGGMCFDTTQSGVTPFPEDFIFLILCVFVCL
jgi:sterol desaturase/sphingolipid hydroxylase (fatty acid hydroxylase superfamily)